MAEKKPPSALALVAWVLLGLLLASVLINVFTFASIGNLRRAVDKMREPAKVFYLEKLKTAEARLNDLAAQSRDDKGKLPNSRDFDKLSKKIANIRELWGKADRSSTAGWIQNFWKLERAQGEIEKEFSELESKLKNP